MTSDDLGLTQSPAQAAEGGLSLIEAAIVEALGERCTIDGGPSDPDCLTCRTWTAFDALSAEGSANAAAARLAAEEMRERAEAQWRPASEAPNGWHRTYRLGEDGATWSHCWTDKFGDREWSDPQGRTTVTHGTYAPPTHYLAVKAPPLPLPPSSPEDQEKAKAAATPTIADPDVESGR